MQWGEAAQETGGQFSCVRPRVKGYRFVVVFKECLDSVGEIVTLFLWRGEPQ